MPCVPAANMGFLGVVAVRKLKVDHVCWKRNLQSVPSITSRSSGYRAFYGVRDFPGIVIAEEPEWKDCIQGSNAVGETEPGQNTSLDDDLSDRLMPLGLSLDSYKEQNDSREQDLALRKRTGPSQTEREEVKIEAVGGVFGDFVGDFEQQGILFSMPCVPAANMGFLGVVAVRKLKVDHVCWKRNLQSVPSITSRSSGYRAFYGVRDFAGIVIAEEPKWKDCIQCSNAVGETEPGQNTSLDDDLSDRLMPLGLSLDSYKEQNDSREQDLALRKRTGPSQCCDILRVSADIGTATSYDPPYLRVEDTAKINSQKMDTLLAPVMVYGTTVPPVVGDTAYAALAASSDPAKMDPLLFKSLIFAKTVRAQVLYFFQTKPSMPSPDFPMPRSMLNMHNAGFPQALDP
ncbi:hypothetical protein TEA_004966 [Camellia sinensis var. sinensis]|uniref:Uncharacterized protein n=1 Tax=Camellia sinensis var. sinensis TaxID=542762 RepID=A0A4S4EDX8_CAMSN|nr:hypothetical protein TEA_004966 [Camellia sinensis var. sinensis]